MPTMVSPVARPKRSAGFRFTALATMRAASRPTSWAPAFNTSSMRCPRGRKSSESANKQFMAVGSIKREHIHYGLSRSRKDQLANAKKRLTASDAEQFRCPRIGRSGIYLFIRVAQFQLVIPFKDFEQRFPLQRCRQEIGEIRRGKIAGL